MAATLNASEAHLVYMAAGDRSPPLRGLWWLTVRDDSEGGFLDIDERRLIVKNSFVRALADSSLAALALAKSGGY